jgi:long-chain acyl-CoA synthetase
MIYVGITVGYASPKTLTDASMRNCSGDLAAFKPSIMVGVPAVWEMIKWVTPRDTWTLSLPPI